MKYLGSKRRIAKQIMPVILKDRKPEQLYVEPFVGGANSFEYAANPRLGADTHEYLIAYLEAISKGYTPPTHVSELTYKLVKDNPEKYPPKLAGFIGFACSFSGKWFAGYARDKTNRDYPCEGSRNAVKQGLTLNGATFVHASYNDLVIPDDSLVYCDPPYQGTTGYKVDTFDHEAFWTWAENLSSRCTVFVSEYAAPDLWECVWRGEQLTHLDNANNAKTVAIEKLFRLRS